MARDEQTAAGRRAGQEAGGEAGELSAAAPEEPTFEEALARLEHIVEALERGDAPLHEALALFEEGVGVARLCSRRLDEAETKIRMLLEAEDGTLVVRPAAGGEDTMPPGSLGIRG